MEVAIDDSDVIKIILEFLQSQRLFVAADALQNESGVQLQHIHESFASLHDFAVEGKWVCVGQILRPIMEMIDREMNKKILYLLFRQRFCEMCFSVEETTAEVALKDIVEELQTYCSDSEFDHMMDSVHEYYDDQMLHHSTSSLLLSTRLQCIHDITNAVEPVLGLHYKHLQEKNERLISLLVKGVLYDYCVKCCEEQAQASRESTKQRYQGTISAETILANSTLSNISGSLVRCLTASRDSALFQHINSDQNHKIRVNRVMIAPKLEVPSPTTNSLKTVSPAKSLPAVEADVESTPKVSEAWVEEHANESHTVQKSQSRLEGSTAAPGDREHLMLPASKAPTLNATEHPQRHHVAAGLAAYAAGDNVNLDARDSYADFLAEQAEVRMQRDRVLKEIQIKQEQAEEIRKNLQASKDSPQHPEASGTSPHTNATSVVRSSAHAEPHHARFNLQYHALEKTDDISAIRAVAFHPYGQVYAVGSNAQTLKICATPRLPSHNVSFDNSRQGLEFSRMLQKKTHIHKASIYAAAWNGNGSLLATCSNDKLIKLFDYDPNANTLLGPTNEFTYHQGVVRDVSFLPDYGSGSVLASAGSIDCLVYTVDCRVDAMLHKFSGHTDQILSLHSWDRGLIVSSSQDRSVRVWDLRASRCISVLGFGTSPTTPSIPTSVCVDSSGRHLVVGRDDCQISVYDLLAGKVVKNFEAHQGEVRSVRFNPSNNSLLLSGSYDGTALVTDIQAVLRADETDLQSTSYRCCHHTDKVIQCRWHPSGRSFASTSADHTCVLWTEQRAHTI